MLNNKFIKWLAGTALVVTAAGVLAGCYVETRRPFHAHERPVIFVR